MKSLKNFVLILLMSIFSNACNAQEDEKILAKVNYNGYYGYIDTLGREVIPAQYPYIGEWSNNLAPIRVKSYVKNSEYTYHFGYINTNGKIVITPEFDQAEQFHEKLAAIKIKNKWGFIDTKGHIVIYPKYENVSFFIEGLCAFEENKKWGLLNTKGEIVLQAMFNRIQTEEKDLIRVSFNDTSKTYSKHVLETQNMINRKGEILYPRIFKSIGNFKNNLAVVEVYDSVNSFIIKKGYINRKGTIVIPAIYDIAYDYTEGYASVGIRNKSYNGNNSISEYSYNYIDTLGKIVINGGYSSAENFRNGYAVVGIVDTNKKQSSLNDNEMVYVKLNYGVIDRKGNVIIGFKYDQVVHSYENFRVMLDGKYGIIDKRSNQIIPIMYNKLVSVREDLIAVSKNSIGLQMERVIDNNGMTKIESNEYSIWSKPLQYNLFQIKSNKNKFHGIIGVDGKEIIVPKYEMIWDFLSTK